MLSFKEMIPLVAFKKKLVGFKKKIWLDLKKIALISDEFNKNTYF